MRVYASLITGNLYLHKDGEDCNINICAVEYVLASCPVSAERKSKEKFIKNLSKTGEVSQADLVVEKLQTTRFRALWANTAFWTYSSDDGLKDKAIKETINWHRYIK